MWYSGFSETKRFTHPPSGPSYDFNNYFNCGCLAGYLFYTKQSKPTLPPQNPVITTQTPPPTVTPSPATAEITKWKTFVDENLKYSVEYPANWFSYPTNGPLGESSIYSYDMIRTTPKGGLSQDQLKFAVIRFTKKEETTYYKPLPKENIVSESKIIVDGIGGTKQIWKSLGSGITITVNKDNYFYHISAYPVESKYINIFDQILSTFKFTP